jgi:hypothetical protein
MKPIFTRGSMIMEERFALTEAIEAAGIDAGEDDEFSSTVFSSRMYKSVKPGYNPDVMRKVATCFVRRS